MHVNRLSCFWFVKPKRVAPNQKHLALSPSQPKLQFWLSRYSAPQVSSLTTKKSAMHQCFHARRSLRSHVLGAGHQTNPNSHQSVSLPQDYAIYTYTYDDTKVVILGRRRFSPKIFRGGPYWGTLLNSITESKYLAP